MENKNPFGIPDVLVCLILGFGFYIFVFVPSGCYAYRARNAKCKANLTQFGTALTQYQLDLGGNVWYPQKQGQGFITTLYKECLLVEELIYLCPATNDVNSSLVENAPELGNSAGPVSYAGRINTQQSSYPGLFKLVQDAATTPLMSDDFPSQDEIMSKENHIQYSKWRNVLFLDGHIDEVEKYYGDFRNDMMFDVLRN